jgi:predicted ribosomally synthesized peptide with SipW-like signal peptide
MVKTILMSLLVIAVIGGLAGGGLFAHFSDTETSEPNSFTAGYLDLVVDGNFTTEPENIECLQPCQWVSWDKHVLHNAGTCDGLLGMQIDITDWSGGVGYEPELLVDPTNKCDLQNYLEIIILYCEKAGDDVLPIVQGSADFHVAWTKLYDAGYNSEVAYAGLLKDFDGIFKDLGKLLANQSHDFQVLVHLQQPADANKLMGDYVQLTKTFSLEQVPCAGEEAGGGKYQNLPYGNALHMWVANGDHSYFKVKFDNIPAGSYCIQNDVWYKCWCIDELHDMPTYYWQNVKLKSSLSPLVYTSSITWGYRTPHPNLFHYVNYLINTYSSSAGSGSSSLQQAIWFFINHHTYSQISGAAQAMVDDALLNGADFVPETGQVAMVVGYDGPEELQIIGIEVDP